MRVKNVSGATDTWAGQELTNNQEFDIPVQEINSWRSSDKVITDITNGDLQIGDATAYKTSTSEAIGFLLGDFSRVSLGKDPIQTLGLADGDLFRARLIGIVNSTVTKNQTSDIDWKIPQLSYSGTNKVSYMDGIEYKAIDAEAGDKITFQVVDKDNILGYGAGTVLDEFGKDWGILPDTPETIKLYKAKLIPNLYIRIKYTSAGTTNDVKLICNLFRHMDTGEDA